MPSISFPSIKSQDFLNNGSWTSPINVTEAFIIGCGGGGGGRSYSATQGGIGGDGAQICSIFVSVVPNVTYTITLGNGGAGGSGSAGANGGNGQSTSFGALATLPGALGAQSFTYATAGSKGGGNNSTTNLNHNSTIYALSGMTYTSPAYSGGGGSALGAGGNGAATANASGASAPQGGGGGGGAGTASGSGGAGGKGQLTVYWLSIL